MKERLTQRECDVLEYLAKGFTICEISKKLQLSDSTVITHKNNLKKKLSAKNIPHLVALAIERGIL